MQSHPGVDTSMVSKWERGAKGVSPRYRALLAALFRVPISDLGLARVTAHASLDTPTNDIVGRDRGGTESSKALLCERVRLALLAGLIAPDLEDATDELVLAGAACRYAADVSEPAVAQVGRTATLRR